MPLWPTHAPPAILRLRRIEESSEQRLGDWTAPRSCLDANFGKTIRRRRNVYSLPPCTS